MGKEIAARRSDVGALWKRKLELWAPSMAALLPKEVTPERMIRLVLVTFQKNPKLMECSEASVYGAVMEAVKLGLEIDCAQQAWLVPYKNVATLLIGYQGLAQLCFNSGMVTSLKAEVVRANDRFDYSETESGTSMKHVPHWLHQPGSEPGPLMAVYAIARLADGTTTCSVYGRPEIERHRDASVAAARDSQSPWHTHEAEMWKKTAIRILVKLLPKSTKGATQVMRAVELDEGADRGTQAMSIDADFNALPAAASEEQATTMPEQQAAALDDTPIFATEVQALFAMTTRVHGDQTSARLREVLGKHSIKMASKIPRYLYAQIWEEVETGTTASGSELSNVKEEAPEGVTHP